MLCFAKDRLYLVESDRDVNEDEDDDDEDEGTAEDRELRRRRILVLSLQGDILQVVTHPTEPAAKFGSICCFDGKLLASYYYEKLGRGGPNDGIDYGMLALRGL